MDQLRQFQNLIQATSREIMWINDCEEEELLYDWSDRNTDISRKQEAFSVRHLNLPRFSIFFFWDSEGGTAWLRLGTDHRMVCPSLFTPEDFYWWFWIKYCVTTFWVKIGHLLEDCAPIQLVVMVCFDLGSWAYQYCPLWTVITYSLCAQSLCWQTKWRDLNQAAWFSLLGLCRV